mmetsp:Transcript_49155/g.154434  ORF Transcript_49155/g.154434 Transcript_49155/m.154434 type:complete len:316 (-) Transcript_49155:14-961(-)
MDLTHALLLQLREGVRRLWQLAGERSASSEAATVLRAKGEKGLPGREVLALTFAVVGGAVNIAAREGLRVAHVPLQPPRERCYPQHGLRRLSLHRPRGLRGHLPRRLRRRHGRGLRHHLPMPCLCARGHWVRRGLRRREGCWRWSIYAGKERNLGCVAPLDGLEGEVLRLLQPPPRLPQLRTQLLVACYQRPRPGSQSIVAPAHALHCLGLLCVRTLEVVVAVLLLLQLRGKRCSAAGNRVPEAPKLRAEVAQGAGGLRGEVLGRLQALALTPPRFELPRRTRRVGDENSGGERSCRRGAAPHGASVLRYSGRSC